MPLQQAWIQGVVGKRGEGKKRGGERKRDTAFTSSIAHVQQYTALVRLIRLC